MFKSIVVGTDGSDTATQAVREAVDMAAAVGVTLELVSAYAPAAEQRLRAERRDPRRMCNGRSIRARRSTHRSPTPLTSRGRRELP